MTPEDLTPPMEAYQTLAADQGQRWGYHESLGDEFPDYIRRQADDPNVRADVEAVWRFAANHFLGVEDRGIERGALDVDVAGMLRTNARMNVDLADMLHRLAAEQVRVAQRLHAIDHPDEARAVGDAAWHSIWLHGNWRFLTKQMTTEEKNHVADAVERHWARGEADDLIEMTAETRAELRWWR